MSTTIASSEASSVALESPPTSAMIEVIGRKNPQSNPDDVKKAGEAIAALTRLTVKLSPLMQERLAQSRAFQRRVEKALIAALLDEVDEAAKVRQPLALKGAGLGELLNVKQGRKALSAYAEPVAIEDWAGSVAGPSELQAEYGIARSTLHAWQQQGAVVGLLKGVRKHVFPLAQFVDARPIQGLADVLGAIGDARTSWLWLVTPHPELADEEGVGQAPIDRLKAGAISDVVELARGDYGQS